MTGEILARTLQRWSYNTTLVGDGALAWERLRVATGPTLAILDWMMPEMDGPDVCRRVRQELPLANMYLLLVTARESRGDVVAGLDAGADDYIIKPFDPEELRARVAVGLRVLGLQQKLAERVAELQEALTNVKQLHGLLPICSYCKRIRGDDQYWQQVEGYIDEHSDAQFTRHRPACYATVSPSWTEMSRQRGVDPNKERVGHAVSNWRAVLLGAPLRGDLRCAGDLLTICGAAAGDAAVRVVDRHFPRRSHPQGTDAAFSFCKRVGRLAAGGWRDRAGIVISARCY